MKKITALVMSALLLAALLAGCSAAKPADEGAKQDAAFEWTREGFFEDADGNYLTINYSDTEGYEGWAVSFMSGEEPVGWIIQQEGDTLHGDLDYEDSGEYIVTISEEGEDGVMMEVEGGETYHFTPMDIPDATVIVNINTEGQGQITYAAEGEELTFDDAYPAQSAQLNLEGPETYQLGAKADEGWQFVKWTKDGEDYSTDEVITVEFTEAHTDFIAVFEMQ